MLQAFENIVGVDFWTALFTFCNMIITFLILKKFLFKPVKRMIDDRQAEIDGLYADANRARDEARTLEEEYRARLDGARQERDAIVREATARAQQREREIVDAARADADALRERARADIARERTQAVNEIKNDLSDMAVEIAARVAEKEIDAKQHEALIEDFIRHMGDAS